MATSSRRLAASAATLGALVAATALPLAASDNWPSFRGNGADGTGTGSPPATWNVETGENILFHVPVPGLGHSSPVIWEDRVFLTTAVPEGAEASLKVGLYGDGAPVEGEPPQHFQVLAFDKRTGELLWERTAFQGTPAIKRHTKASHTNSTPATDGNVLVAFFGSEGLHAYDLDGNPLWELAAHWVRGSSDPLPPKAASKRAGRKAGSDLAAGSRFAQALRRRTAL
jgi:outer membrane protein assembly factor BamB